MKNKGIDVRYKETTGGRFHCFKSLGSRHDEVQIMTLRARQSKLIRGYLRTPRVDVVKCHHCNRVQDTEHILVECPDTVVERMVHLGGHTVKELLTKYTHPLTESRGGT
eukprot:TRINITY_DN2388_c1_g2_i2.p2 TRINITY_DN2388_c1_g2~~TRINITY_DN2388_c1_g2_i2.p2  ORF type:complete len:109 (-),score=14.36 TRINITY_DN2388_c1_g2_i2:485-811(-)